MRKEAIYARQSVDKKDSLSIEGQIEQCKYKVDNAVVYQDKGYSGKNTSRPELQNLINDIKEDKISKVVVYKLDRISRNITDFYKLYETMEKHNCNFESVSETFDTSTSMGRAMMGILAIFAQMERENIQKRVKDNYYYRTAETGSWAGGPPPYGFRIGRNEYNKPTLVVDKHEMEAVEAMFALYCGIEHCSLGEIARWLDDNGYKPRKKGAFESSTISKILQNPIYVVADNALYKYFKTRQIKFLNKEDDWDGSTSCHIIGKRVGNSYIRNYTDMKEQSVYLTNFPGVIYSVQYINAQKQLSQNKQISRARQIGRLEELSGKLKCSKCGYAIKSYNVSTSDGRPYLSCYGKSSLHVCDARYNNINFYDLQEKVGEAIQKELDGLSELYLKIERENHELEERANNIKKEIENIIEIAAYSGDASKAVASTLEKKQRELDEIELKIELNKSNADYTNISITHNVELKELDELKYEDMNEEQKLEIVRTLIDKITLTEDIDTFEIKWNI